MGAELRHTPARKGLADATGKFASNGFNLNDQFCGEEPERPGVGSLAVAPNVFARHCNQTEVCDTVAFAISTRLLSI